MAVTVIVADVQQIMRDGLKALLPREGAKVIGEAGDGRAAVELVRTLRPQIALMDIQLPLLNGIDAARAIASLHVGTRPVLLTFDTSRHHVMEALRAGIRGYVSKTQGIRELAQAIREVAQGGMYLSPAVSQAVVDRVLTPNDRREETLTPRERQVLQLVAEGKTTREIASLLHLGAKTIESHRRRIMGKLELDSTPSLVRYAVRHGLVSP
jgi:two-component system response regulator NreC